MGGVVERFTEHGGWVPPWIRHEHLGRYRWVSQFVDGYKVIDAACGSGYGAKTMVAHGALRVDGFDVSFEAVEEARATGQETEKLHFAVADVKKLPVPDHYYDVYVSFETIEHVEDDQALLAEVVRVLKPGGKFVCSTPNRNLLDPGKSLRDRPFNPYHLREYTLDEFESLLRGYFRRVRYFGQTHYHPRYGMILGAIGKSLPGLAVRLHQIRKLCAMPWERPAKHYPAEITDGHQPEVLIAVAT